VLVLRAGREATVGVRAEWQEVQGLKQEQYSIHRTHSFPHTTYSTLSRPEVLRSSAWQRDLVRVEVALSKSMELPAVRPAMAEDQDRLAALYGFQRDNL
jgi:hypothetical protein